MTARIMVVAVAIGLSPIFAFAQDATRREESPEGHVSRPAQPPKRRRVVARVSVIGCGSRGPNCL